MWVRAVWKEGDREEEGVVPEAWVKDGMVHWPPGVDASRAMKSNVKPASTWRKFKLQKLKYKSSSLSECEAYDVTTATDRDSTDDEGVIRKRKRKQKDFPDYLTALEEIEPEQSKGHQKGQQSNRSKNGISEVSLPTPPKKAKQSASSHEQSPTPKLHVAHHLSRSPSLLSNHPQSPSPTHNQQRSPSRHRSFSRHSSPISPQRQSPSQQISALLYKSTSPGRPFHHSTPRKSPSPHSTSRRSSSSQHLTPRRSSSSRHLTPRRSSSQHLSPHKSSSSQHLTSRRSSSQHLTPRRSSSSQHLTPRRSSSSQHLTPHRSSSSRHCTPHRSLSPQHLTPRRSSSSSQHLTPRRSSSSQHLAPRRSSSQHLAPRRSSSQHLAPRRSSSQHTSVTSPYRSSAQHRRSPSPPIHRSTQHRRSPSPPIHRSTQHRRSPTPTHHQLSQQQWSWTSQDRSPSRSSRSQSRPRTAQESQASVEKFPMPEGRFQKRVLYLLSELKAEVNQLKRYPEPVHVSTPQTVSLEAAGTLDDFRTIEDLVKVPEERQKLIQTLSKIGGSSVGENVRSVMGRLMTNELMSKFNLKGGKQKLSFRGSPVCMTVIASVMKTKGRDGVHEHEIMTAIQNCLKYAPDRRGGGGRKKGMAQAE